VTVGLPKISGGGGGKTNRHKNPYNKTYPETIIPIHGILQKYVQYRYVFRLLIQMYVRPGAVRIRDRMRQTKPVRTEAGSEGKKGRRVFGALFLHCRLPRDFVAGFVFLLWIWFSLLSLSLSLSLFLL
jgi:hypothetical protein